MPRANEHARRPRARLSLQPAQALYLTDIDLAAGLYRGGPGASMEYRISVSIAIAANHGAVRSRHRKPRDGLKLRREEMRTQEHGIHCDESFHDSLLRGFTEPVLCRHRAMPARSRTDVSGSLRRSRTHGRWRECGCRFQFALLGSLKVANLVGCTAQDMG